LINSLPPLSEIEHVFFLVAAVFGAAEIVSWAVKKLSCRIIKDYFKIKRTIIEERSSLPPEQDRAPASSAAIPSRG
jgi:hypothetical protein